jgi:hypothetical protein
MDAGDLCAARRAEARDRHFDENVETSQETDADAKWDWYQKTRAREADAF